MPPTSRAMAFLLAAAVACAASTVLSAAPDSANRKAHVLAHILAPERLRNLLPASLDHLARGDISAERVTALGIPLSEAEAQYRDNQGHYITLRIEDTGGAGGLKTLVRWASTRTAHEQVHEQWQPASAPNTIGYGEYAVIVSHRYLVEASGKVAGIDVLKRAVERVDLAKLRASRAGRARPG